jgi:hypothetical protein
MFLSNAWLGIYRTNRKTDELFLYAGITGTENPAAMQDYTIHGRCINLEILNHPGFIILIKKDVSLTNYRKQDLKCKI